MATQTSAPPTCEAIVSQKAGAFGFEPVLCRQSVGLTVLFDAAGITHRACSRAGHRSSLVRRFGETVFPAPHDLDGWPVPDMHNIGCPARYPDVGGDCDEASA
jgi:hypothetical protein